ncbi:MAG: antibiotic biosynthesis monooxygenase [bacterium]
MIVTCVTVYVKEGYGDDFIKATLKNHQGSVKEPGNLRFDVLQCVDDPLRFLLYEAYESEEAAAAHKKRDHYLTWKETVADFMAKPREGVKHTVISPTERDMW